MKGIIFVTRQTVTQIYLSMLAFSMATDVEQVILVFTMDQLFEPAYFFFFQFFGLCYSHTIFIEDSNLFAIVSSSPTGLPHELSESTIQHLYLQERKGRRESGGLS